MAFLRMTSRDTVKRITPHNANRRVIVPRSFRPIFPGNPDIYWDFSQGLEPLGGSAELVAPFVLTRAGDASVHIGNGTLEVRTANVARLEESTNGRKQGLVLEAASTNYVTASEAMWGADWTTIGATVLDGGYTLGGGGDGGVATLREAASGTHQLRRNTAVDISGVADDAFIALGFYLKGEGRKLATVIGRDKASGWFGKTFDLSAGGIVPIELDFAAEATTGGIRDIGGGWYRCFIIIDANTGGNVNLEPRIYLHLDDGEQNYTGDPALGVDVFGGQAEWGPVMSSYIPTPSDGIGTAGRAADDVVMTTGPPGVGTWFPAAEGSYALIFEQYTYPNRETRDYYRHSQIGAAEFIRTGHTATGNHVFWLTSGGSAISEFLADSAERSTVAAAWGPGAEVSLAQDRVFLGQIANPVPAGVDRIELGSGSQETESPAHSVTLRALAYYFRALSAQELLGASGAGEDLGARGQEEDAP